MKLFHLSDERLLSETKLAVQTERDALTVVLHHLLEVDRRKLFSSLKYPSLFEYAVVELKYSRHEAYDRISAMRLLRELPEIETKINTGTVNLTNLCLAKTFFNQEKKEQITYSKEEKLELINQLENKSSREAQKIVYSLSSNPQNLTERTRIISDNLTEYKFTASEDLENKIQKLKGLLAHSDPNISMAELINKLCDIGLKELDPTQHKVKQTAASIQKEKIPAPGKNLRHIPAYIKREIWAKDQGRCSNCGSQHALEFDHIQPVAKNGETKAENLRLLCRTCNQRAAIRTLGVTKMNLYLR